MVPTFSKLRTLLPGLLFALPVACGDSEGPIDPSTADGSVSGDGGVVRGPDGEVLLDGAKLPDGAPIYPDARVDGRGPQGDSGPPDASQGTCTAGAYRCATDNVVQICNSSGTAWLHVSTCAVGCQAGLCTGTCTANEKRCNGGSAEKCDASGSKWTVTEACSTSCHQGSCAKPSLDVALNTNLDGTVWVDGDVLVHSGATLSAPKGVLTIIARSITVQTGGSIAVSPTATAGKGTGRNDPYGPSGGSYGSLGESKRQSAAPIYGSTSDTVTEMGSPGGAGGYANEANFFPGGNGGGVLRLIAQTIDIAGQVSANGANGNESSVAYSGGGGGSGGGVLLAGNEVRVTGTASAVGGNGGKGSSSYVGGKGGNGRVKILSGAVRELKGTISGEVTQDILPPLDLGSSTHPAPSLTYNNGFDSVGLSWTRAFPSVQGYYVVVDKNPISPPTPATGKFVAGDFLTLSSTALSAGDNYVHLVPVDASSNVGKVETTFLIKVNDTPPSVTSQSHASQAAWSDNANPFFAWTFPSGDSNIRGAYYVFDQYGTTLPTTASTFLPVTQKQQLLSNITPGVWVMHVIGLDQQGYLTKTATHYRVNIGTDPGTGGILGQVIDSAAKPVAGASVSVNRGLYTQPTNATGNYNFGTVPAGTWEVSVVVGKKAPVTTSVVVTKGNASTANLTVP